MIMQVEIDHSVMDAVVTKALAGLPKDVPFGHAMRQYFDFDPGWTNLNHGSFGSPAKPVRAVQRHFQDLAESRPDPFIRYTYKTLLASSRTAISTFANIPEDELLLVSNATTAVNTVLRGLTFSAGDHILYFDFIYGACGNTVLYVCETTPAEPVRVEVELPIDDEGLLAKFRDAVEGVKRVGGRVKVAVFDTVASQPGLRLPFEKLVKAARKLGVLSLVDGAHGVGNVELDVGGLDADFLTSNCHKWLYTSRSCALLHIPKRNQALIRSTLPTSWGFTPLPSTTTSSTAPANPLPQLASTSAFVNSFDSVGTVDGSPYLTIPTAIAFRTHVCGGESRILSYCHALAERGARIVADRLGTDVMPQLAGPCCMAMVRLPLSVEELAGLGLQEDEKDYEGERILGEIMGRITGEMAERYGTYLAIMLYRGGWYVRLSAQVYLEEKDFVFAAEALKEIVDRVKSGEYRAKL